MVVVVVVGKYLVLEHSVSAGHLNQLFVALCLLVDLHGKVGVAVLAVLTDHDGIEFAGVACKEVLCSLVGVDVDLGKGVVEAGVL